MKDRVVQYPNRFNLVDPDTGSILQTVNIVPNPGVVSAEGDDLNKANLLPDDVVTALGLTGNPQVKDALAALLTKVNEKARLEVGSYVGTGTYGASNPNSLTFGFAPKFVWIFGYINSNGSYVGLVETASIQTRINPQLLSTSYDNKISAFGSVVGGLASHRYAKRSTDGKTVYWYVTLTADKQFNESGVTYFYVAIG